MLATKSTTTRRTGYSVPQSRVRLSQVTSNFRTDLVLGSDVPCTIHIHATKPLVPLCTHLLENLRRKFRQEIWDKEAGWRNLIDYLIHDVINGDPYAIYNRCEARKGQVADQTILSERIRIVVSSATSSALSTVITPSVKSTSV
jgi:hypothetical protein